MPPIGADRFGPSSVLEPNLDYRNKISTIRTSSMVNARVRILNVSHGYDQVDVDEIFVDLQCEPFKFNMDSDASDDAITPCLKKFQYNAIESATYKHVVILGLPGAGKTTLLKKVFKEYCKIDEVIPIYVELKQEEKRGRFSALWSVGEEVSEIDVLNYLVKYFAPLGIRADSAFLEYLIDKYKIAFFCDGLDEISKEQYDQFTKTVQALSYYNNIRFIISSRQVGFSSNDYDDELFGLFSLMDFDEEKQRQFIDKYFNIILPRWQNNFNIADERKSALERYISNPSIQRMAKSPVLLSLLCVMPNVNEIKNKTQLFQKAIKVLLNNRNFVAGSEQQLLIDFLKEIAVIFFKLDKAEHFDIAELTFYAERFFGIKNAALFVKLKENDFNCGLFDKIDNSSNSAYKFAHRTIWEYLVAEGMASEERDRNEIYNRANMGMWEEPIKMWIPLITQKHPEIRDDVFKELWIRNKALTLSCMNEFDPFPQDVFTALYGGLSKRDKLRLIATLRDSYVNPSSDYRKQAINTIRETLTLIHSVERDCEVVYAYVSFLEEFEKERVFSKLLYSFLDYEHLSERMELAQKNGLEFSLIPAGSFLMGRNKLSEKDVSNNDIKSLINVDEEETPAHMVRITRNYNISKTLITNKMFYSMGFPYLNVNKNGEPTYKGNPYSASDDQPVNYPNWYEAVMFAKWLGCTLPTEAEWEYACRSCGKDDEKYMQSTLEGMILQLDRIACYASRNVGHPNRTRRVLPINQAVTNTYGLQDMLGNLREWCLDWYDDDFYKKCSIDSGLYPSYSEDIKGREVVSYYFNADDKAVLVSPDTVLTADVFSFDSAGNCLDPIKKYPGEFEAKCLRGGCFDWNESNLRPTYRNHNPANNVYKVNGFRIIKRS